LIGSTLALAEQNPGAGDLSRPRRAQQHNTIHRSNTMNPSPFDADRDSAALPGAALGEQAHAPEQCVADFTDRATATTQQATDRWPPSDPPAGDDAAAGLINR
jgi:hypothetical protein